jgi:hypothetical protein
MIPAEMGEKPSGQRLKPGRRSLNQRPTSPINQG